MNAEILIRSFHNIGAELRVQVARALRTRDDFILDIERNPRERFLLTVWEEALERLELFAVDIRPKHRHLLLVSKRRQALADPEKRKFLCGHDERHWFVASVPRSESVATVEQAMEALKPQAVVTSQWRNRVDAKRRNARRNAGFIRQGEWFFLPRPDLPVVRAELILRGEPILRSGGTPHIVEELYRTGGETVYVCGEFPHGVTEIRYQNLLKADPNARKWSWQVMRRNPTVYARGRIRHPDHATVKLPFWHEVVLSAEQRAANVAFLD